ncbi:MAG: GNAT family N-acetyltransferase [Geminicoccaceae bacterium]
MIRRARPEDAVAVRQIANQAYRPYVPCLGKAPAPMVADFAGHIDQDWVIVFEREGVVRGYAILLTNERRALLDNIAVDPACQRSGIGVALIAHVEQRVVDLGYEALDLYTNVVMKDNVRWYEKLGFVETRRVDEAGFRRIYMRKCASDTG